MIPTSYLFKDIYHERWGDPANPHPVEIPAETKNPSSMPQILAPLRHLLGWLRHEQSHAWSFIIRS